MTTYGYSIQAMTSERVHAVMQDIPVSYKVAVLIAQRIKGMPAQKGLRFLNDVVSQRQAVPYTKFSDSVGHRPGSLGPGRYPEKAAKLFIMLLSSAIANAEDKGLGKDVWIEFVIAQQGSRNWRNRPSGRHKAKKAHVEIVLTNAPMSETVANKQRRRGTGKKTTKTERNAASAKTAQPVVAHAAHSAAHAENAAHVKAESPKAAPAKAKAAKVATESADEETN